MITEGRCVFPSCPNNQRPLFIVLTVKLSITLWVSSSLQVTSPSPLHSFVVFFYWFDNWRSRFPCCRIIIAPSLIQDWPSHSPSGRVEDKRERERHAPWKFKSDKEELTPKKKKTKTPKIMRSTKQKNELNNDQACDNEGIVIQQQGRQDASL